MKIFIEIPTWLGDAVMATPAIENIIATYPTSKLTIMGSFVSTKLFLYHPNVEKLIVDDSKKRGFRYYNLYKLAKSSEIEYDLAFSFRKNFTTKFLLNFIKAKKRFIYKRYDKNLEKHQVIRYNDFVNKSLKINTKAGKLKIYPDPQIQTSIKIKKLLGINPGATYGSAKRWYPQEFANICQELSDRFDIVIFGGPGETDIALDIQKQLENSNISNFQNLAGKTSVEELIVKISTLDLFITNDSGPMHVAAAFDVPTISIFGPTRFKETSQWMNPNGKLIRKELECSPCMKRVCPLGHHDCMKLIKAKDVLDVLQ
ncbi:MAG: lipopolysaccharide heptosyltransferase II [Campylobacterales bacterium]|nr:lipopolysaccharide heptosyltransferase II [Campylobacterales bacterium]